MLKRLKGLKRVTPGERQAGPPRRSDGCGRGVAFACAVGRSAKLLQSFKGFRGFKRFKRFNRRSDGCGRGVAFACAVGRSAKLLQSFKGFRGFKLLQSFKGFRGFKRFKGFRGLKGLRAGKRQAWTPIRSHGCGLGVAFACARGAF